MALSLSAVVLGATVLVSGAPQASAQGPAEAGNPAVTIVKVADQATVVAGADIDYHLTVTNTGDVTLTGLTIIDPKAPACAGPIADLAPSDAVVVDCTYTTIDPDDVGTYSNAAVVTSNEGALALSNTVDTTVETPTYELTVTKSADQTTVVAGDAIDFHVNVANTGNLDLTGVTVTDATVPACDTVVGALAVGADTTIDCTYTTDAGDVGTVSNTAAAVSDQTTSVDSNQVDVPVAAESFSFDATLTRDQASVVAGEDIDYHITIDNTGNRPLTGLEITDAEAPDCEGPLADLAAGDDVTVDCTYTTVSPGDVGTYTNTATVASNEVADADTNQVSTTVVAQAPGITIVQTKDRNTVFASEDIDLHLTLHNTGNMTLTGVTITDTKAPDCAGAVPDLAAGGTTVIDCTYTTVLADVGTYHNTARVDTNQTALLASNQISVTVTAPSCFNEPVNVSLAEGDVPTEGHDVILGTAGPDAINSLGGADFICALAGDDVINSGSGNDQIYAMAGDDTVHGGSGDDYLFGVEDEDTLGGDGGVDYLEGGIGNDVVSGGTGKDALFGNGGADTLNGGADDDYLDGVGGDDTLNGGLGEDSMHGGVGHDTMSGGDNDDSMYGFQNADEITGDGGNDYIVGGDGTDTMNGGTGNDQLVGAKGSDIGNGETGNDVARGGDGNDRLHGNDGNDVVFGDAGNDVLFGDAGVDRVIGGSDNDTLSGGTGYDACVGGTGFDTGDSGCNSKTEIP